MSRVGGGRMQKQVGLKLKSTGKINIPTSTASKETCVS